ncbi:MAG: hypothetical protein L0241_21705, partial [Planctomycetia bacterium]|nr:hypothetical protein [Planctomycetia bacterium]
MPDEQSPEDREQPGENRRSDRRNRRDDRDERDRDRDRDEEDDWDEEDEYEDRPRRRRRRPRQPEYDPALKMVVPLNTSALAIVAGYLGLISVLCFPAPFALLFGILA